MRGLSIKSAQEDAQTTGQYLANMFAPNLWGRLTGLKGDRGGKYKCAKVIKCKAGFEPDYSKCGCKEKPKWAGDPKWLKYAPKPPKTTKSLPPRVRPRKPRRHYPRSAYGDDGGVSRIDDFPAPSVVRKQPKFTLRGGRCCGMTDSRKHSFHLEKTIHGDCGGCHGDDGGLAAATGTPNERGYWLEDKERLREYSTGSIQDAAHGGRVARISGRKSRHEPVLLLPNEVVLTEKQAMAARKAGAKLPTHSLQKRAGKLK